MRAAESIWALRRLVLRSGGAHRQPGRILHPAEQDHLSVTARIGLAATSEEETLLGFGLGLVFIIPCTAWVQAVHLDLIQDVAEKVHFGFAVPLPRVGVLGQVELLERHILAHQPFPASNELGGVEGIKVVVHLCAMLGGLVDSSLRSVPLVEAFGLTQALQHGC